MPAMRNMSCVSMNEPSLLRYTSTATRFSSPGLLRYLVMSNCARLREFFEKPT